MKTAILSVGTEILFGQIVNTNTVYLSQQLQNMGFDVMYHYTVGDNPTRLKELIGQIFEECDMILTTGGLGPTQDDLTKEMVTEALHDTLVEWPDQMEELKKHFPSGNMPANNIKQAWFPTRAEILPNPVGTAPGFTLEDNGKYIFCMPGPPSEMQRMFEHEVRPRLEKFIDGVLYYKFVKTIGIGESQCETELLPLIDGQTDPTIATYAKDTGTELRVTSKRATLEEAKAAVDAMIEDVYKLIGPYVYSLENEDIQTVIVREMAERGLTLASAESCTAGKFSALITDVPGSSAVFNRGYATYSNQAKIEDLGVDPAIIEAHGAVSRETALAMAEGLYKKTGCDICISITGIAGPDGGTEEKPVGTFFIGINYAASINEPGAEGRKEAIYLPRWKGTRRARNRNHGMIRMAEAVYRILHGTLESM